MLDIVILLNWLVDFIERLENEDINPPGDHRTNAVLPEGCCILSAGNGVFVVFATSWPVCLADPEVERFLILDCLDVAKGLYLGLVR